MNSVCTHVWKNDCSTVPYPVLEEPHSYCAQIIEENLIAFDIMFMYLCDAIKCGLSSKFQEFKSPYDLNISTSSHYSLDVTLLISHFTKPQHNM